MMWKLCHKLFGWHYVLVDSYWVCRVRVTPLGRTYVVDDGEHIFLDSPGEHKITELTRL